ncbi:hypothetical protein CHU92_00260 [Flavobacterium cyanobacteriorum]|uniref:Uncharacterized protein n=1 Tax=Flavobacterium cyanobacteriorum TaxID=2022802 RepID=A0A256A9A0_9FLAO|nr:hypothetical protein [Flavobacterium cyanobacteriorum]OYQ49734.1 hypothetical protein CHU92_00260 [Flavobacterium cyanobacteriorum]
MIYKYKTPQDAITSLEIAYTNKDDEAILNSKDFETEARLILEQANYNYDLNDSELITETAELLKLSLIQNLQENGYPNFNSVKRNFSNFEEVEKDLYTIIEELIYPDGTKLINKIYMTCKSSLWKVALIEE